MVAGELTPEGLAALAVVSAAVLIGKLLHIESRMLMGAMVVSILSQSTVAVAMFVVAMLVYSLASMIIEVQ